MMDENEKSPLERLVAAQGQDPKLKLKYQKEIDVMLNKSMPRRVRVVLVGLTGILLWVAFLLTYNLRRAMESEDSMVGLIVPMLVLVLAVAVDLAWVAWRGRALRASQGIFAGVIVGFGSMIVTVVLRSMMIRDLPLKMAGEFSFMMTVIAVVGWVPLGLVVNSHYHEKTREKLLEIQLQVAELAEQMRGKK
jgi:cellobiose-specific phosphotransferase system component IIC